MEQLKITFPDEKEATFQRIITRLQKNIEDLKTLNTVYMKQVSIKNVIQKIK